jgi:hypothetical protein
MGHRTDGRRRRSLVRVRGGVGATACRQRLVLGIKR